jgi:hypothetical protein
MNEIAPLAGGLTCALSPPRLAQITLGASRTRLATSNATPWRGNGTPWREIGGNSRTGPGRLR